MFTGSDKAQAIAPPTPTPLQASLQRVVHAACVVGLLGTLSIASPANAGQLYRYTNAQGGIEIASSIPNELVVNGYQIIDSSSGRTLKTVAAQLTPAQAELKAARAAGIAQCRDTQRRVNSLYNTLEDVDHAEGQAIESIETRIINAQASLTQLRIQQRDLEDQAARLERSGHGVTAVLVNNIDRAKTQIGNLELEVLGRRVEQEEERKQFDRDRVVLNEGDCVEIVNKEITTASLRRKRSR